MVYSRDIKKYIVCLDYHFLYKNQQSNLFSQNNSEKPLERNTN